MQADMCNVNKGERKNTSTCLKRRKETTKYWVLLQDVKGYHNGNICNFLKCHFILFISSLLGNPKFNLPFSEAAVCGLREKLTAREEGVGRGVFLWENVESGLDLDVWSLG
jgi:hypothetical protein